MTRQTTVLLVESDSEARERVAIALQAAGFAVLQAAGGLAALDVLEARTSDAIVFDVDVPDTSGLLILEMIATGRRTRHLPLVVIMENHWLLRVAPDAILIKPVRPDRVVAAVTAAMRKRST